MSYPPYDQFANDFKQEPEYQDYRKHEQKKAPGDRRFFVTPSKIRKMTKDCYVRHKIRRDLDLP